jgi:hypothetical protein
VAFLNYFLTVGRHGVNSVDYGVIGGGESGGCGAQRLFADGVEWSTFKLSSLESSIRQLRLTRLKN